MSDLEHPHVATTARSHRCRSTAMSAIRLMMLGPHISDAPHRLLPISPLAPARPAPARHTDVGVPGAGSTAHPFASSSRVGLPFSGE
jgi:hypothetical protein